MRLQKIQLIIILKHSYSESLKKMFHSRNKLFVVGTLIYK